MRRLINRATLKEDLTAGLVLGTQSVPDGLAGGLLAAVNPIYGLYGYMMGTVTGALFTSSDYMAVQATGAMAVIVAGVPWVQFGPDADAALFMLTILTGAFMLIAGLLKGGSLIRFVPNAVMVGFVNAVAVRIILGQLGNFTGYAAPGANSLVRAFNTFTNPQALHLPTVLVGTATIILILTLERTRLGAMGMVVAMIVASLLAPLFGAGAVAQVNDIAVIPSSLPRPALPPLSTIPHLLIPALSLAFVGLVQGAAISRSYVNADGKYPNASGDFVGQGAANLVSGLFQGMPVGGSFSATSLVVSAGARTRFANLVAGIVMAIVIVLFGRWVGLLALPALAGLLIVIGFRTLKPDRIEAVWKTGPVQRTVMVVTFLASLLIPLQYAVLLGVALAIILYVIQRSNQVTVKEYRLTPGELPMEQAPPAVVPGGQVTVLVPYGSLFFAAAPMIEQQLPEVTPESAGAAVILRLPREEPLGSTFLEVLARYNAQLHKVGSQLVLAGASVETMELLERTGMAAKIGYPWIFKATDRVGESMTDAWYAGQRWVAEQAGEAHPDPGTPT
jgi:SulP family sulfate permease